MKADSLPPILVADDNPTNLLVIQAHLSAAGYEVLLVGSGQEAIAAVETTPVSLIVLDVMMPGLDGFETCERIRQLDHETPVLFLTALSDHASHERALEVGADDYITKPLRHSELLIRIRSLIRLKRLIETLRTSRDELLLAQEQRRSLSRMVVHDLKSPLQGILGYCELLQAGPPPSPKTARYVAQIQRAGNRMRRLVGDILETEHAPQPGLIAVRDQVALAPLLQEVAESCAVQAKLRGCQIDTRCEGGGDSTRIDAELVRRALTNLVQNAIQYASQAPIQIVATQRAGTTTFEVRDQGPGVPRELRAHLFEPCARLRPTLADPAPQAGFTNQGLGLAFCRLAAQAHEGRIWIADNAPRGSRFCFTVCEPQGQTERVGVSELESRRASRLVEA